MMYYWHTLHLDENELLHKFYVAQKLKPNKNDWVSQILKDKKDLKIEMSDEDVKTMLKLKFKQLVETKINEFAKRCFLAIQLNVDRF